MNITEKNDQHATTVAKSLRKDQNSTRKLKLAAHKKHKKMKKIHDARQAEANEILKKEASCLASRQLRLRSKFQGSSSKTFQAIAFALTIMAACGCVALGSKHSMAVSDEVRTHCGMVHA